MRCLSPRTVGFKSDGKTLCWSKKQYSKEFATFQLPCGKCRECRLEYARTWAIRCVHESLTHEKNSFITLTYSDENLKSPRLQYQDFQKFMKRLRDQTFRNFLKSFGEENWKILSKAEKKEAYKKIAVGVFVTGEYGDRTKRPHWHAILFNWEPPDLTYLRTNERGDRLYTSKILDKLWGHNDPEKKPNEIGAVTFESAGYVARYAAKKLIHGYDQDHDYHPISKKSSHQAIGKAFLEKYWKDIFNHGEVILPDGKKMAVPRYYEKWLEKHEPEEWVRYVTETKLKKIQTARSKSEKEKEVEKNHNNKRALGRGAHISRSSVKNKISEDRFKRLQKHLKGDI